MSEVPDIMDPMDEMPQTLQGMLSELIELSRKMLGISDRLISATQVGTPDPLVHGVIKLGEITSLMTATLAKVCEEVRELKEKGPS